MSAARDLRSVVFFAVSAFVVLGPIRTQVLLQPGRSNERPWLPMSWQMYHSVGSNMCQAVFSAERNGERTPLPPEVVAQAVGPTHHTRFTVYRKARSSDVLLLESELGSITRALCNPNEPDVRVEMRCSPDGPGGRWRTVEDGSRNVCTDPPKAPRPVRATAPPEVLE